MAKVCDPCEHNFKGGLKGDNLDEKIIHVDARKKSTWTCAIYAIQTREFFPIQLHIFYFKHFKIYLFAHPSYRYLLIA